MSNSSLYALIKQKNQELGKKLKVICDWDECLKPLNPWVSWNIAKNRGLDDGISFKEFFLEYWKCLKKVRTDTGSQAAPKEISWESGKGTKIEKYGKWRNDNHKLFQTDYANIKKAPDFQKKVPWLSVAEELLKCLREDLISELVITSNWHMKLKDAELFHPIHGDERKINQYNLTFGLFPNTKLRLVKTSPDKSGPFRWEWIKENHPDFDVFIDDSGVYIERTRKLFPDRVFAIPDYASTEYLQYPNIYHVKQEVSDLKDEDFEKAANEYKAQKEQELTPRQKNQTEERERERSQPTVLWIGLGVVGLVVAGVIIHLLTKKKT